MKFSEAFNLGQSQSSLDFVDVDIVNDTPLFVDPWALRHLPTAWGEQCVNLIQDFFSTILGHVAAGNHEIARGLLLVLTEPNEVKLGLSSGRARGRGLGPYLASEIYDRLQSSRAVTTGLLEDLEDTLLFVDGIGPDIISDITINIIRGPLIEYTQRVAAQTGILLTENVSSGHIWAANTHNWRPSTYVTLPVSPHGKHILVPKIIVRRRLEYDVSEYYSNYVLEHLQREALAANSELVHLLKNGKRKVFKKDLEDLHPKTKRTILDQTIQAPDILRDFREAKDRGKLNPLSHGELTANAHVPPPNWDHLMTGVTSVVPGREGADAYEKSIAQLLTALFYPHLVDPIPQTEIHEGRKRIDLTFTNVANSGFWGWLGTHYTTPKIYVECKNYVGELGNPELDQLAGRFSPRRGRVGLLVCRNFDDKLAFIRRCRDTADDDRGFIIPLDDTDLQALVDEAKLTDRPEGVLLKNRFDRLIM